MTLCPNSLLLLVQASALLDFLSLLQRLSQKNPFLAAGENLIQTHKESKTLLAESLNRALEKIEPKCARKEKKERENLKHKKLRAQKCVWTTKNSSNSLVSDWICSKTMETSELVLIEWRTNELEAATGGACLTQEINFRCLFFCSLVNRPTLLSYSPFFFQTGKNNFFSTAKQFFTFTLIS